MDTDSNMCSHETSTNEKTLRPHDLAKLNVGGTIFETTWSTLSNSGYFRSMYDRWVKCSSNTEKEIFIDSSPHLFKHIISLLRNPSYPYPLKYKHELDFYVIDFQGADIKINFYDPNAELLIRMNQMHDDMTKINDNVNRDKQRISDPLSPFRPTFPGAGKCKFVPPPPPPQLPFVPSPSRPNPDNPGFPFHPIHPSFPGSSGPPGGGPGPLFQFR